MSKELRVLITESGGPAAVGLIKSILKSKYTCQIFATDCKALSAGNLLSDSFVLCPPAEDDNFIVEIEGIIEKNNINVIIPTGEHDLEKLSYHKEKLRSKGCKVFCSDTFTIHTCQQKHRFYNFLKEKNINLPLTIRGPFIEKPIKGSGSRGIEISESRDQIIQQYISGKEYTVDIFCDMHGFIISHVIRERVFTKAGISVVGKVCKNTSITEQVQKAVKELKIKGPACMQFIVDKFSIPYLIECNPRLGGGTYISTLAGVNCADIYFDLYFGKDPCVSDPKEITVVRYFEEIVV
tara:strand:- start:3054 stop:3938 length:885 start_codon:yes stop_codon:yes gene_type:complete